MSQHVDLAGWMLGGSVGLASGLGKSTRTLTDLTALISCFWVRVLMHLSITVWCRSVFPLRCLVQIPIAAEHEVRGSKEIWSAYPHSRQL